MICCPGGIAHYDIYSTASPAVKVGKYVPVEFLGAAAETSPRTGMDTFCAGSVVQRGEHVGGNGGIVDVGGCRYGGKKITAEGQDEGVAHCVYEDVGD